MKTELVLNLLAGGDNPHKFNAEIFLIVATIALAVVTAALTWVSYKLYKVTAQEAEKIAHNSIDSMENVAITAIKTSDRHRMIRKARF